VTDQPTPRPRDWLKLLNARYDHGAVAQGIWEIIKYLEAHESWRDHVSWVRRAAAPAFKSVDRQTVLPAAQGRP
jgi:hypothetical protein